MRAFLIIVAVLSVAYIALAGDHRATIIDGYPFGSPPFHVTASAPEPSDSGVPVDGGTTLTANCYGQSNCTTSGAVDAGLSLTQPYDNIRWTGSAAEALVETPGETPTSGWRNGVTYSSDAGLAYQSVVYNGAVGGQTLAQLTVGTANFNTNIENVQEAYAYAADAGSTCLTPQLFIHGESNSNSDAGVYTSQLITYTEGWQSSVADAGMVPCRDAPVVVATQLANEQSTGCGASQCFQDYARIALEQVDMWRASPQLYTISHPQYPHPHSSDGTHLSNIGHLLDGEYAAKAEAAILAGGTWEPLHISSATCNANVITAVVSGGRGSTDLTLDTSTIPLKPMYGFEYGETSPQADLPVVTGVSLDARTITVTLDRNCESDGLLRYGFSQPPGFNTWNSVAWAGGNVRNQDTWEPHSSNTGRATLPDWLIRDEVALDSCTGCTASAAPAFANTDSFAQDNSPSSWLSCGALTTLQGIDEFSVVMWARGNGSTFSGNTGVLFAQNTTSHRLFDWRTIATNSAIQIFIPSGATDTTRSWTSGASSHEGCASAWCMLVAAYDLAEATTSDKLDYYLCAAGTCTEISASGTFNGTWGTVTNSSIRADLAIGGASSAGASQGQERTISHVQVYTRKLSADDVDDLYNSGTPVDPRELGTGGPVRYWPLQGNGQDLGSATSAPCRAFGTGTLWSTLNP